VSNEAYIYEAIRTPRGKNKGGALHGVKPIDLVTGLIHELQARHPGLDPAAINDIVLGVVSPVGDQGADIARAAAMASGLPDTVAGVQLNRFCASGREDVDRFAVRSQEKAEAAWSGGYFAKSVVPVKDINGVTILDHDEHRRPGTTLESLGKLKPAFEAIGEMGGFDAVALQKYHSVEKIDHVHTGGNSSGIVDGAALVLLGNEQVGKDLGLTPRARIVAATITGSDPTIMLTGPTPATKKVLEIAGLTTDDIDLFELNEAFASVVLKWMKDLKLPDEKVNVNGGAIAMGHPLGATGAMILGTMVDELERRQARRALLSLCIGGGMGIATIIERV
jgi:acetyl-CoA C-acetyltransferase